MKKLIYLLLFTASLVCNKYNAQISYGGSPYSFSNILPAIGSNSKIKMAKPDIEKLKEEDKVTDLHKDIPYRFGNKYDVDLGINNSGEWILLENGDRIWRLAIECKDAISINFAFDQFYLPQGGKLFVYDKERTTYLGAFTEKNNKPTQKLGVGFILADNIIIEYYEPADKYNQGILNVDYVTHGYRKVLNTQDKSIEKGPFGTSGSCNNNVICPEGDPFVEQISSVGLIVVGGFSQCTGAMVANTSLDNTPYFLTADHCLGSDVDNWVFYFNHQSATCIGSTGPTNQSVSGSTLVANNSDSDFALLLLDDEIPADFNVVFSGWDRTGNNPLSAVGIHHPSGDVKKISFAEAELTSSTWFGTPANSHWHPIWDDGVTEGGSSGSPLFDQNKRIVGQLHGGASGCGNDDLSDEYGKFSLSWDGVSASTRLKDWLDPSNTEVLVLGGETFSLDAQLNNGNNENNIFCADAPSVWNYNLFNNGSTALTSLDINYTINGNTTTLNWTGNLQQGFSENIAIPLNNLIENLNNLEVVTNNPNGVADENDFNNDQSVVLFNYSNSTTLNIAIQLDQYPSETSWNLRDADLNIIYSGNGYNTDNELLNIPLCVGQGCYVFEIFDSYGDGLEDGYIIITDQNENLLAEENSFTNAYLFTEICASVGLTKNNINTDLEIYPNPSNGFVTIWSSNFLTEKNVVVNIYNALGQLVLNSKSNINGVNINLDCSELENGIYSIQCKGEKSNTTQKLIIKK
jgi:lysyl endopeptidase